MAGGGEIRARIDTETVRGLQLINGGMAAGLITLLPTIVREPSYRELGGWMIVAVLCGAVGLVAAVVHNRLRRKCSFQYSKERENRDKPHQWRLLVACQSVPGEPQVCTNSVIVMWASLLFFFLGAAAVGIGFWRTRAVAAEPTTACWALGQLGSQAVKLNTCTGKVVPLPGSLPQTPAATQPTTPVTPAKPTTPPLVDKSAALSAAQTRHALDWSLDAITSIDWLEIIKALAPVATAVIAFVALKNWQRQDKAKREAEFLDALIEAAHTYIAEMRKPITLLDMAKIGMESHAPPGETGEQAAVKGAIAYIQKNGEHESKRLLEALEAVQPSTIKLRSLVAKGQVFKFDGYAKCQNAVAMLTWHLDRIEAFMAVIGSPTWNWDNPEVLQHLKDMMAIDPNDMRKRIQENNVALLEFAGETYRRIYG
jgi:hypothetical protein